MSEDWRKRVKTTKEISENSLISNAFHEHGSNCKCGWEWLPLWIVEKRDKKITGKLKEALTQLILSGIDENGEPDAPEELFKAKYLIEEVIEELERART